MPNVLNYVDYDFDSLKKQLQDRLKVSDAWKDIYRSSTGDMLIDLYAYIANMVLYSVERMVEESYLGTAKLKSSVVNLVRLLNYLPKRKVSSRGQLKFSISPALTSNVEIPEFTECQTDDGIKFLTVGHNTLLAGSPEVLVDAVQGELVVLELYSDGSSSQQYSVKDTAVENSSAALKGKSTGFNAVRVTVQEGSLVEDWRQVSSFLSSFSTDTHFVLRAELDDTLSVLFGDGVKGKIPSLGAKITVKYVRSLGILGNVLLSGKIVNLISSLYDGNGALVTLFVTNTDIFVGGGEAEGVDEIRDEAPKVFRTGDRLVTKDDFVAFIKNLEFPKIAAVSVWGENEESAPNYDMFNRVKIVMIEGGVETADDVWTVNLPAADWDLVQKSLYEKSLLTVKYEYVSAVIVYVVPRLVVKVLRGYSLSEVQDSIEDALKSHFILSKTTNLAEPKRLSDLLCSVEDVAGVSYQSMALMAHKELLFSFDSLFSYGENLDALPVLPRGLEVYFNDDKIAVDDGSKVLRSLATGADVGSIDYITGVVGVDVATSSGDSVYVRYRQGKEQVATLVSGFSSAYAYGVSLGVSIKPYTVRIFVGNVAVAEDNGAGGIDDLSGGSYIVSGIVNYTTGVVQADTSPPPTDTVYVKYQAETDGDLLVTPIQICRYHTADIDISYV